MRGKHSVELAEKYRLWEQRLSEWKQSGLSQAQYCRQNKLDPKNFLYWKNKLLPPRADHLVELPAKILPKPADIPNSPLCLIIDGRFRLEVPPGFDPNTVERLICVLSRR